MRDFLLAGLSVTLLFAPIGQAFAQDLPQDPPARQEAPPRGGLPQQDAVFANEPIVIETELFTLEVDVGVFLDTYCYKPTTIDPCGDVRRLLEEHRVMSDIVREITRQMEEDLEGIKGELERSYRQQIRMNLERQTWEVIERERQRDR